MIYHRQVLEVVRNNYDSLTLKLHDSLDQYEKYAEKPQHANFFTNMVRDISVFFKLFKDIEEDN